MMKKVFYTLATIVLISACQPKQDVNAKMEAFHLNQVRLLDGPFKRAQEADLKYILEMDVDRLIAPYLVEAGLTPVKEGYGNWEGSGLNGHIGGHYLSALSMMYAANGSPELNKKIDYMLAELKKAQDANGNGYLSGVPDGKVIWEEIAAGNIRSDYFSLNDRWVPLYNIHKIFAGLRDAYLYASKPEALEMWKSLSDWWLTMTNNLSDDQIQLMLKSEHGGLNEVFADLYKETGEVKYLEMAEKLSHKVLLDPLLLGEDHLTGMHANTQIPKVIGYERVAEESGKQDWHQASVFFWDEVVNNRSIAIGGNSVREHFHSKDNFRPMVTSEQGPETCNTYNMMRLSKELFLADEEVKYLDYYEKAQINHILSSQHPDGGFVYFTPARPRHYRVYSQPDQAMWCCVGSGIENHTKYGELIYSHKREDLFVNLFIASELDWNDKGVQLTQTTSFPEAESSELKLSLEESKSFKINLRIPSWINGEMDVQVNGSEVSTHKLNGYLVLDREWNDGDVIEFSLPMSLDFEQLPDGSNWVAFTSGPVVMAAVTDSTDLDGLWADDSRMGHVANGQFYPVDKAPLIVSSKENLLEKVNRESPVQLKINQLYGDDKELSLVPFFQIHEARYMMYWPYVDSAGLESLVAETAAKEAERMVLRKITVDVVSPGEQQPESEHGFKGENTWMGYSNERYWRSGWGWFSYTMTNRNKQAKYLRVQFESDNENGLAVLINGTQLSEMVTEAGLGEIYVDLPSSELLEVRIQGIPDKHMPRIYDVRLLSEKL
ncbi:glycoside hydrolase family 127 protein [Marinoscillum pacificum]|uniref:glycoside hydrolase family 127 protein n=1 Tax=Marinoscillum pacificum TaxID=392723 RepID=UPI002157632C|nr:glycoside hydrolase family 127 protein [Marinoscillum pacificum]